MAIQIFLLILVVGLFIASLNVWIWLMLKGLEDHEKSLKDDDDDDDDTGSGGGGGRFRGGRSHFNPIPMFASATIF